MEAIKKTAGQGISLEKACEVLDLPRRRYYRWQEWSLPEPRQAWNRMLPQEEEAILCAARREDLAHLRTAGLMVWGHDTGAFHAGLSSVHRVLKQASMVKPYEIPRRKKPIAPDVRHLMNRPLRIAAYDDTEFVTVSGVIVKVILLLDMGSRKFLHFGVAIRAITQKDVKKVWDEALRQEGLADARDLTILSDRGGSMKGQKTKRHLEGLWYASLAFSRPHTPDDNAWIEALIKTFKYHPECPEAFWTVLDVQEWARKFQKLYNDHPHSALKYVTPNQEHRGEGNQIRHERRENLLRARERRLAAYKSQKQGLKRPRWGSNVKLNGLSESRKVKKLNLILQSEQKQVEAAQAKLLNSSEELCRF